MSVGISQVNFDAQVLEDEEEAALEKEDQEREQEIRELLDRELDDGLLDDDNASFSSHDPRSSGYSRETPFSDEISEQVPPAIFNRQDSKRIIPSENGAFERPSLMTQRAFQLVSESGKSKVLNPNEAQEPYDYHPGHQYENQYETQAYYHREQESPDDEGHDRYNQNYNGYENGVNYYQTLPNDVDVDQGFEQYGSYSPHQNIQGKASPQNDASYSNLSEDSSNHGGYNLDEDYGGYIDKGTYSQAPVQTLYTQDADNTQYSNEQNFYRIDTPGNYRVHYHGHHERFPHANNRVTKREEQGRNDSENGFSGDGTQDTTQLQILYKARGRKIEELTQKLQNQEEEMAKEIRILKHQIALMKDERDGIATSLENSQQMVQTCNTELNNLKGQLAAAYQQINALKESKEEVVSKLHVSETTIDSLNQQLVELSRSESLTRAKEQHESVTNAMKKKHEEQTLTLKQKLDEAILSRDCKNEEVNQLRDELVQKAEMINSLTRSLDSSQKQCQEILKSGKKIEMIANKPSKQKGTMSEINQLRMALQETSTARNVAEGQCISLKHELSELQGQIKMYGSASRLGVGLGPGGHNESLPHLTARNLNKENWSTPKSHKIPLEETVSELRKELEHCLISYKAKQEQVHQLETNLVTLKDQLKDQEMKAQRMEQIAQEHENKSLQLEKKIKEMEDNKKDPDEEHQRVLKDLEITTKNLQESTANLKEALQERDDLTDACAELKQQMAEMVAEFDEDKRNSIEKKELEENSEELIRIKECYVQLGEESRGLEQKMKEEFEKEKQLLLSGSEAKLVDELRASLETQHAQHLEEAQDRWRREEMKRINDEVMKQRELLLKDMGEEKFKAVEEAVSKARMEWSSEQSSYFADQIAAAKREWIKDHNDELEKRLANAIEEVRRIWDEEQKLKTKEEIVKVRTELEKAHGASRDQQLNQAVELALSQARADWLKNEEEMRQREIDQAVEVAITNAVAEAKKEWQKEIVAQDSLLQTSLTQERLRWKKEDEAVRTKAIEAAVAIAEVKWLEEEQKKISEAVEQAMKTARETWQEEKKRDIAMAVDLAKQGWMSRKEDEVNLVLESASSQLVEQFEQQKKEAVEKALGEALLLWEKRLSEEKASEIASIREEIFREFEEQKKAEIMETLEEAKEAWTEESEQQKRKEVNEAMAYVESEYNKNLEDFKHKTLRDALEQARKQWTTEELSHREKILKVNVARILTAQEDWRKETAKSTQEEIDRALSTAREAWAVKADEKLESRVREIEANVRQQLGAEFQEENKKLVDEALQEAEERFNHERKKLEENFHNKADDSSRGHWEIEKARLLKEHQNYLEHMRTEYESKLADQRAKIERDLDMRMRGEVEKARNCLNKEQQDVIARLEKQYEQKARKAVENARIQWEKQQQQEISKSNEDAVKRQQELRENERRENLSTRENMKHELASVKKEYAMVIEKLKREIAEEKKKSQYNMKRRDSRDNAAQTLPQANSGSDTSFSSVDHESATRGLHELRQYYLDTIAKIRDDVLNHVHQTKASAAKKIRGEVLKERHSTAKKLRKYYLQCLKQLLEEDRVALEGNRSPISADDKLNRMAEALKTLSPDKESTGQHFQQPEVYESAQTPRSALFTVLRTSSEPDVRDLKSLCTPTPVRPRDGLPDGASDTAQPVTTKDRAFTPILGKLPAMDDLLRKKQFAPEREYENFPSKRTNIRAMKADNLVIPALKHATDINSKHDVSVPSDDKEKQVANALHERAFKDKPSPSYKRNAASPAFSTKSYESDQYSELPTVIHVSRRESSGSKDSNSSVQSRTSEAKDDIISPIRPPSAKSRTTHVLSREKRIQASAGLPSKPRIDVRTKRVQKS
ncbi:Centrosomal protein of 152 kDa [Stylophora pistillata]|uniref:Centrosomal protein of 152 kDa n=1 Tax=Stylophora pistillata TaxID=50429 RepID=A0A2B4SIA7_STYPI|nr:Centrosomal protein of 152 kDa [Stylophora pistillata]